MRVLLDKKRSSGVAVNMPACHAGDRGARLAAIGGPSWRRPAAATVPPPWSRGSGTAAVRGSRVDPLAASPALREHLTFNQRVRGSSPLQDTILKKKARALK